MMTIFNLFFMFLLSFLINLIIIKLVMPLLVKNKIVAIDQQKETKPLIPTSAGIPVFISFLLSLIIVIFVFSQNSDFIFNYKLLLISFLSIFLVTLVGFLDDINFSSQPVKNNYGDLQLRVGLSQWVKPLLSAIGAIPLLIFTVGESTITLPIINLSLNLGLFYYLIFVPVIFIVISNSTNMLAGTNGLEGSLMLIVCLALGVFTFINQRYEATIIAFIGAGLASSYLVFNWYPAKILPGDSFTYLFGAFFAVISIVGNIELFACFIFIPWVIEILLKIRGRLRVRSLGDLQSDGTLMMPYSKLYSWTHIFMFLPTLFKKRFKEWQITLGIDLVCIFICVIAFIIFL